MKSGVHATKTVAFTMRAMLSSPPVTDAAAARALRAAVRAASAACSSVRSAPTLPVATSVPATVGSWPEVITRPADAVAGT